MRWHQKGRGKRGGLRIIYYHLDTEGQIWLLDTYAKNVQENVLGQQAKRLKDGF